MQPYSKDEFDTVAAVLRDNVERFRFNATGALSDYTPENRSLLRKVRPQAVFYMRCQDSHYPLLKLLNQDKPYATMRTRIAEGLAIGDKEATDITDRLYAERYEQLIQETIAVLPRTSKRHATRILRLPSARTQELLDRYKQATIYRDVARTFDVAIYDPHSSHLARYIQQRQIRQDRQQTRRLDAKNIAAIDATLQKTDDEHGDLLRRIVSHDLEIITLLGVRNEVAKKTARQPDVHDQLDQFDKTIKKFVHEYIDEYKTSRPDTTLYELSEKKHAIERIVHDLLALGATERNQLVVLFSDYRTLSMKRDSILFAQRDRDAYSNRET